MTLQDLLTAYQASGGPLGDKELRAAGRKAWSLLCQQTMDRLYIYAGEPEPVEQCFCELVEAINQREAHGVLASESVGQWSQGYVNPNEGQTSDQVYAGIIRRWLGETGLLYRGWP